MVIWIVLAVMALGIVVLVAAVLTLLGRLRLLDLAVRRTRLRVEQAERLQVKIETLRVRADGMRAELHRVATGAERLRERRRPADPEYPEREQGTLTDPCPDPPARVDA